MGVAVASPGCQPMKLRATAMPIDAPMPAVPPAPTAADSAATVDAMLEVLWASRSTAPWLSIRRLFWPNARVLPSTTFCATAPAPLTATPAVPPMPSASEAAAETALMVFLVTLSVSGAAAALVRVSTKVWPSGATSVQLWPSTSVWITSFSTSIHLEASV